MSASSASSIGSSSSSANLSSSVSPSASSANAFPTALATSDSGYYIRVPSSASLLILDPNEARDENGRQFIAIDGGSPLRSPSPPARPFSAKDTAKFGTHNKNWRWAQQSSISPDLPMDYQQRRSATAAGIPSSSSSTASFFSRGRHDKKSEGLPLYAPSPAMRKDALAQSKQNQRTSELRDDIEHGRTIRMFMPNVIAPIPAEFASQRNIKAVGTAPSTPTAAALTFHSVALNPEDASIRHPQQLQPQRTNSAGAAQLQSFAVPSPAPFTHSQQPASSSTRQIPISTVLTNSFPNTFQLSNLPLRTDTQSQPQALAQTNAHSAAQIPSARSSAVYTPMPLLPSQPTLPASFASITFPSLSTAKPAALPLSNSSAVNNAVNASLPLAALPSPSHPAALRNPIAMHSSQPLVQTTSVATSSSAHSSSSMSSSISATNPAAKSFPPYLTSPGSVYASQSQAQPQPQPHGLPAPPIQTPPSVIQTSMPSQMHPPSSAFIPLASSLSAGSAPVESESISLASTAAAPAAVFLPPSVTAGHSHRSGFNAPSVVLPSASAGSPKASPLLPTTFSAAHYPLPPVSHSHEQFTQTSLMDDRNSFAADSSNVHVQRVQSVSVSALTELTLRIFYDPKRNGLESQRDFPIEVGAVIAGRYRIVRFISQAAFSRAAECLDIATQRPVCVKVVNNSKELFDSALDEIKLLRLLNSADRSSEKCVVSLLDFFYHREHLFLVLELLAENLFEKSQKVMAQCVQQRQCNRCANALRIEANVDKDVNAIEEGERSPVSMIDRSPPLSSASSLSNHGGNRSSASFASSSRSPTPSSPRSPIQLGRSYEFDRTSHLLFATPPPCLHNHAFSIEQIRAIAFQLLTALQFIHSQGIIHADIKPENIVLEKSIESKGVEEEIRVKVIDFGGSAFVSDPLAPYVQSRPYRAPEVFLGVHYTQAIDLWSAACVLFEIATGRVLFSNGSSEEVMEKISKIVGDVTDSIIRKSKYANKFYVAVPVESDDDLNSYGVIGQQLVRIATKSQKGRRHHDERKKPERKVDNVGTSIFTPVFRFLNRKPRQRTMDSDEQKEPRVIDVISKQSHQEVHHLQLQDLRMANDQLHNEPPPSYAAATAASNSLSASATELSLHGSSAAAAVSAAALCAAGDVKYRFVLRSLFRKHGIPSNHVPRSSLPIRLRWLLAEFRGQHELRYFDEDKRNIRRAITSHQRSSWSSASPRGLSGGSHVLNSASDASDDDDHQSDGKFDDEPSGMQSDDPEEFDEENENSGDEARWALDSEEFTGWNEFIDLLTALLQIDADKRLTAAQALNHQFFARYNQRGRQLIAQ